VTAQDDTLPPALTLDIDLAALAANWRAMAARSGPARASAVVKANGYGLGIEPVVRTLSEAGCRDFFTATIDEAITARRLAPHARILVLNGIYPGTEQCFRKHRLTPILCSMEQVRLWDEACTRDGRLPYALHVDTGMNRLGVTMPEALALAERKDDDRPTLIMSHLACADDPDRGDNARQLESFQALRGAFQGIESSLSNSAGIFLGGAYLCDLTRPGIALYGGEAVNRAENPMQVVATAKARILQIRRAPAGSAVSYGGTARVTRDTKIAHKDCSLRRRLCGRLSAQPFRLRRSTARHRCSGARRIAARPSDSRSGTGHHGSDDVRCHGCRGTGGAVRRLRGTHREVPSARRSGPFSGYDRI
jgi:alanine racemase